MLLNTSFDRVVAKYYRVLRKVRTLYKEQKREEDEVNKQKQKQK